MQTNKTYKLRLNGISIGERMIFGSEYIKYDFLLTSILFHQFNAGGKIYNLQLDSFGKYQENILQRINGFKKEEGRKPEFLISCDPKMFRHIWNFCRYEKLLLPRDFQEFELLMEEAESFGMLEMMEAIDKFDKINRKF